MKKDVFLVQLKIKWLVPAEKGTIALRPSLYVPEPELSFRSCAVRKQDLLLCRVDFLTVYISKLASGKERKASQMLGEM